MYILSLRLRDHCAVKMGQLQLASKARELCLPYYLSIIFICMRAPYFVRSCQTDKSLLCLVRAILFTYFVTPAQALVYSPFKWRLVYANCVITPVAFHGKIQLLSKGKCQQLIELEVAFIIKP